MAQHNETGKIGEEMAASYLKDNGFTILHRNWRYLRWEMDIIAKKNNILHFIEVKTRCNTTYGYPEDDVSKRKIRYLMSAAEEYLIINPGWKRIQFDILSILMEKNKVPEYFFIQDVDV